MRRSLMLVTAAVVVGCGGERGEPVVVAGGDAAMGRALMRTYGCTSCHTVPGVRGPGSRVGPSLSGFGSRVYVAGQAQNTPENLIRFLVEPASVSPGTAMPDVGVSEEHARHLAAYLYRLR
jgi:cytochrome c